MVERRGRIRRPGTLVGILVGLLGGIVNASIVFLAYSSSLTSVIIGFLIGAALIVFIYWTILRRLERLDTELELKREI
jgi:membrane protein implicated in regulation of membrane protease activity